MNSYPPSQSDVLQTFIEWLNATRAVNYAVAQMPDRTERNRQEIDYLLREAITGHEVAVEVSSTWRSTDAGREDAEWFRWTERVRTIVRGKITGQFRVSTPLRIPRELPPNKFAEILAESLKQNEAIIQARGKEGKYLKMHVQGIDLHVAHASESGSEITFGRQLPEAETHAFPDTVRKILAAKAPKLKQHKDAGRETWLIIYNTFWPAVSPYEVEQVFLKWLGPDYEHIDHIGVVSGDPPADSWMIPIR